MAYCRICGFKLNENAKFCPKCGQSVDVNVPSQRNYSIIEEPFSEEEENELPFWQKLVYLLIPFIGSIATIVLWLKDKESEAKSALVCSLVGLLFLIGFAYYEVVYDNSAKMAVVENKVEDDNSDQMAEKKNVETKDASKEIVVEPKKDDTEEKKKQQMNKYAGKYYYSYSIGETNSRLYFSIVLKSDGSFVHKPNNESTEDYIRLSELVDGMDYPDGGKWEVKETVAGTGLYLEFDGSWGRATINPENNCLEIGNMNGCRFKTVLMKE